MAARLSISPSYLNLIERNRRPLSAQIVVRLVDIFHFDPLALREDPAIGGVDGLMRRLADPRFGDLAIDREEALEFLNMAPAIATAFVRLFDAATRSADDPMTARQVELDRAIRKWGGHFADLDHAAEALADELRLTSSDTTRALTDRLRDRHQLSVRYLPSEVLRETNQRIDYHARQVQLSELLTEPQRRLALAAQLAQLELSSPMREVWTAHSFARTTDTRMFAEHVLNYAAAAIVLPYGRFLRACEQTGYDTRVLSRRFGVAYEVLAERLTNLQRVGQRGLPFFAVTIDRAGQVVRTQLGASGADFLDTGVLCPLWNVHAAFRSGREPLIDIVQTDIRGKRREWVTQSWSFESSNGALQAVAIGLERSFSGETKLSGDANRGPKPIGPGCARCDVSGCPQRAFPPIEAEAN